LKKIKEKDIKNKVKTLILKTNIELPKDVIQHLKKIKNNTRQKSEKNILEKILENNKIAKTNKTPLCQDTGFSIFFIKLGKVKIQSKKTIEEIINSSVKEVYKKNLLRPSILKDPINGVNTKYNIPGFIHIEHSKNSYIEIKYLAKGGGSENASATKMLNPSDGFKGIEKLLIETIKEKGPGACPPLIIGIGIGGTLDKAVENSKKILFNKIGKRNKNKIYAKKELEFKNKLNKLNIGPMGLGGKNTVLDVFIKESPRHIATLAVSISVLCHSARKGEIKI
jgi:fumarate hydratase subunit alpha